jgi:hypothetical protein
MCIRDRSLDDYFRYRVDKACGVYMPNEKKEKREIPVSYISELVDPYCVFVK